MLQILGRIARRLLFWSRREQLERELAEELEFHLRLKEADGSRREMGNITLAREQSRDMWGFVWIDNLVHDISYALRVFGRNPGFASITILSLALGIAGNTAIFSIINTLMIKPLPYYEPSRLLRITQLYPKAILEYFREHSRTMEIAFVSPGSEFNLTGRGPASRITGSETSANFFSVLGATVERGRAFQVGEDRPGNDGVVVISHEFWMDKFGGDLDTLGRTIALDGVNRRVVGIAAAGLAFPSARVQFWIPVRIDPGQRSGLLGRRVCAVASAAASRGEHRTSAERDSFIGRRCVEAVPLAHAETMECRFHGYLATVRFGGRHSTNLCVLFGAVVTVLIIACANVASLLLARATTRRKEVAMRAALGAGAGRIMRQLLTESLVLALTAGLIGLTLGAASLRLFRTVVPTELPGMASLGMDWRVCLFRAAISVLTGLSFGIVPALNAGRLDLIEAMRSGSQRSTSKSWMALRSWLIAGEIALTVVLVVGAGLLMRSLYDLMSAIPAFTRHAFSQLRSVRMNRSAQRESCIAFYNRLTEQVRGISGIASVAAASTLPLDGEFPTLPADAEDHPRKAEFPSPMLWTGAVTPSYFRLLQIPLLAGRVFSEADGANASQVILMSAATAKRFWPDVNPIGKRIRKSGETNWRTVIGVIADVKQFNLTNRSPSSISGAM